VAGRDFGSRSYVDHEHRGHAGDRQLRITDLLVQYLRGIACIWWTKVGLGEVVLSNRGLMLGLIRPNRAVSVTSRVIEALPIG
jgi:hypothetical protein